MSHCTTITEVARSVSIAGKATLTIDSSMLAMLEARIVASSTQGLALAAQSCTARVDWMVPSSHGLAFTLGTRNFSLSHVAEIECELALDLLVGVLGKADRAGAGERLHASGNVDAIAIDIALVDDDVTNIDTDSELNPTIFGNDSVALGHGSLDLHGATGCVNRTRKFE